MEWYCIWPAPLVSLNRSHGEILHYYHHLEEKICTFFSLAGVVAAKFGLPKYFFAGNETFSRGVYYDGVWTAYSFGTSKSHSDCLQECINYSGVALCTYQLIDIP
jgi:hypothetical protein